LEKKKTVPQMEYKGYEILTSGHTDVVYEKMRRQPEKKPNHKRQGYHPIGKSEIKVP